MCARIARANDEPMRPSPTRATREKGSMSALREECPQRIRRQPHFLFRADRDPKLMPEAGAGQPAHEEAARREPRVRTLAGVRPFLWKAIGRESCRERVCQYV